MVGPAFCPNILLAGNVILNIGDSALYFSRSFSFKPSTLADNVAPSLRSLAHLRNSSSVLRLGNSVLLHSASRTTRNNAFPAGIVQVRSSLPPEVPGKNHTGPFCPIAHFSPVSSPTGLLSSGMEVIQFHQLAAH